MKTGVQIDQVRREPLPPPAWLTERWVQHLGVLLLYLGISLALCLPKILGHASGWVLASSAQEASVFVWALRWWPHAIAHGLDPFFTRDAWAPTGLNLTWTAAAPLPALALAPLTLAFGPVVAFNVATLANPALAAWTAYLLCRRVTGAAAASVAGGFFFGFSTFLINEVQQGHLNMDTLFLLPLAAYLVVRRLEDSMSPRRFVALLTIVLAAQFGVFPEFLATMTLVGILIGGLAWALLAERRRETVGVARLVALAYGLTAVVVSPYLYAMTAFPQAVKPADFAPAEVGIRQTIGLLAYVIPSRNTEIGGAIGARLGLAGNTWYFGLPLVAILILVCVGERRRPAGRVIALGLLVPAVLALGPNLPVAGHLLPLPWRLVEQLPLMGRARATRVIAYAFLAAAVGVAVWLARRPRQPARWAVVALAGALILPDFTGTLHASPTPTPTFFTTGAYRTYLVRGETAMVIAPSSGTQLYWQAQTDLYFRLTGWYAGFRPGDDRESSRLVELSNGEIDAVGGAAGLTALLAARHVTVILVERGSQRIVPTLIRWLGVPALRVGGLTVLRLPATGAGGPGGPGG